MSSLIVAVGNDLVGDDAFGCVVYDRLVQEPLPPGVRVLRLGLAGLDLLEHLRGEHTLVLVDAVSLGEPLGTLRWLEWDELPASEGAAISCHGIGIREVVEVGRRLYPERMPERVVLLGCEGCRFDTLGEPLSPEVAAAVEPAVALLLEALGE